MGGHFLLTAFIIRVLRLVRPDLEIMSRRRECSALRDEIEQKHRTVAGTGGHQLINPDSVDPDSALIGAGVVRVHEIGPRSSLQFHALCSQPVQSMTGGSRTEVTCRSCRRIRRRAETPA